MAQVIKLKRSYNSGVIPTGLAAGEIAVNVADKIIYVGNSSGTGTLTLANYITTEELDTIIASYLDTNDITGVTFDDFKFPVGDWGNLNALSTDAFGQVLNFSFDCLSTPHGTLIQKDLGVLA